MAGFNWNSFTNMFRGRKTDERPDMNGHYLSDKNKNFELFKGINNDIERAVVSRSVITDTVAEQSRYSNPLYHNMILNGDSLAMPIVTNKADRIRQYREIAKFPEVAFCIDEIIDDFIHEDDANRYVNLIINDKKELNETRREILQSEFDKFINYFNLKDNAYNYIKRFIIEGEICWENVIKHDRPEMGIIGVRLLPTEYFETLLDVRTGLPIGIVFDTETMAKNIASVLSNGYAQSAQVFNTIIPTASVYSVTNTSVPLLYQQLTYVNSGEMSYDNLVAYPIIEKAKQAYHQLALLQDAAVILRVTRAPERLLFNVSTGRMNQNYADEYVRNFANSLKSKKVASRDGKDISQVYNPVSMLESYVFGKSDGNDGTSVESVGSSADYEQIADIEFFLRRLMKQLKVPFSRYKTPENMIERNETISYEEYSFTRMIVRFQRRFAGAFKRSFITHLKLKGIWEKYKLKKEDVEVEFVKPVLFDLYQSQKLIEAKMNVYKLAIGDNNEFSKTAAMKKYLGMTEEEIQENVKGTIADALYTKIGEFFADKMGSNGPAGEFAVSPIPINGFGEEKASDDVDGGTSGDEGGEDGGESDDSGGDDSSASIGGEDGGGEETPAPSFGLG